MKAIILRHSALPPEHPEIHRFHFQLRDGGTYPPYDEVISLRTARVVVAHLEDGNAFSKMLRTIVATAPERYDNLVQQQFSDDFPENNISERLFANGREDSSAQADD